MKPTAKYITILAFLFLCGKAFSQADTTKTVNKDLLVEKWWSPDKAKNKNKNLFSQFFSTDGGYLVSKGPKGKWVIEGSDLKISQGVSKYAYKIIKLTEKEFVFESMNTVMYFVKDDKFKKK